MARTGPAAAAELVGDERCHLLHGDFFATVTDGAGFAPGAPARFQAMLVDIDHTPRHFLHPSHAAFYTVEGLRRLGRYLDPGGVFALWSDDPPDEAFLATTRRRFASCEPHVVRFPNPHTGGDASNTIYVATTTQ